MTTKERRFIFLDVDGVLNNHDFASEQYKNGINIYAEDRLDPTSIECVKRIVDATNAKIVLSSSWRWSKEAYDAVAAQLALVDLKIFDTTNIDIRVNLSRSGEIQEWLNNNEYDSYLILDDDEIKGEELERHHIQTTPLYGLTDEHVDPAIKILIGEVTND